MALERGGRLRSVGPDGEEAATGEAVVLALGGASWPRLGADGGWVDGLAPQASKSRRSKPAKCGFRVAWSAHGRSFRRRAAEGDRARHAGRTVRGEAMIDRDSVEGGAVYALSATLRDAIARDGDATLASTQARPRLEALTARLKRRPGKSTSTLLRPPP